MLVNNSLNTREQVKNNNIYDMLNVMRFISAIMIVIIHTYPLKNVNIIANFIVNDIIARFAVPFFFISSGYLFFEKYKIDSNYLYKYIKRIMYLYFGWSIVYSSWNIYCATKNDLGLIKNIIDIVRDILFRGAYYHLWYLNSLIISLLFIEIFLRKNKIKLLIIISAVLYMIGLFGDSYYGLVCNTPLYYIIRVYNIIWGTTRNGICFAMPFLMIGILLNKYNLVNKCKEIKVYIIPSFLILSIEVFLLETITVTRGHNMYISLLIVAPIVFISSLNSKIRISIEWSQMFRDMSLAIYCCHYVFIIMFDEICSRFGIVENYYFGIVKFMLVLVLSIISTILLKNLNLKIRKYFI